MRFPRQRKLLFVLIALLLLAVAVAVWQLLFPYSSDTAPLAKTFPSADTLVLWEGLPHQFNEGDVLAKELRSKKTVTLHGFPFYQEKLQLKEKDAAALAALFQDSASFRPMPWFAVKGCGGYHPDFCLEWRTGGEVYQTQICLGCAEIKGFGPGIMIHAAITGDALQSFKWILRRYQKNRPETAMQKMVFGY